LLEEQTLTPAGGQADGNLSNAPLHLGDTGTEAFQQELNTVLLENETNIQAEVANALGRIDQGTFGVCESCGKAIAMARLDVLPYTRFCVVCAEKEAEVGVNLNRGRPQQGKLDPLRDRPEAGGRTANRAAFVDMEDAANATDSHAVGSAGGGTAVGGLAGTNVNDGSPFNADLEGAMGTGRFDVKEGGDEEDGYAGPSGGAVGGTPANKRAAGGRKKGPSPS